MPVVDVNGTEIDFPDSMSQADIQSVLQKKFPKPAVTTPLTAPTTTSPAAAALQPNNTPQLSAWTPTWKDKASELLSNIRRSAQVETILGKTPDETAQMLEPRPTGLVPNVIKAAKEFVPSPGAFVTTAEHAGAGLAPGAAFAAAAPHGAEAGAWLATKIPVIGESGTGQGVGAALGSLAAGGLASWVAYNAQHAALEKTAPEFTKKMDKALEEGAEKHPFAAVAGDVAGNLPSMELSLPKLSQLPFRAALGGTVSAVQPLAQGRKPTLEDVASGAANAALLGESRFFKKIQSIRPAVRTMDNKLVVGDKGDTHNDIIEKNKIPATDVDRRLFVDKDGNELSREQLQAIGVEGQPGSVPGAHANKLADVQDEIAKSPFTKSPLQPTIEREAQNALQKRSTTSLPLDARSQSSAEVND